MELKAHNLLKPSRVKPNEENPFNGIESREHPVVFDVRYSKTSNPFNGIER